jgi:prevent-host-death family protein
MTTVKSTDFQRNPGLYQDMARQSPVIITAHGRERVALLSIEEYRRLQRRDKLVIAVEDMPEEFLHALEVPHRDAEQAALDKLLDE